MRSLFQRTTNKMDDSNFVRRVSKAGLTLAMIWLVVLTTYNGVEGNRRLNRAEHRERDLSVELQNQRDLIRETNEQVRSVQGALDLAVTQNNALSEQIRRLGEDPIFVPLPDRTDRPSSSPEGAPGPPGPQGPPGTSETPPGAPSPPPTQSPSLPPTQPEAPTNPPPPEPEPETPPGLLDPILDPVCTITSILNLCTR